MTSLEEFNNILGDKLKFGGCLFYVVCRERFVAVMMMMRLNRELKIVAVFDYCWWNMMLFIMLKNCPEFYSSMLNREAVTTTVVSLLAARPFCLMMRLQLRAELTHFHLFLFVLISIYFFIGTPITNCVSQVSLWIGVRPTKLKHGVIRNITFCSWR